MLNVQHLRQVRARDGRVAERVWAGDYEARFGPRWRRGVVVVAAVVVGVGLWGAPDYAAVDEADGAVGEEGGDLEGAARGDGVEVDVVEGGFLGGGARVGLGGADDAVGGGQGVAGRDDAEDVVGGGDEGVVGGEEGYLGGAGAGLGRGAG